MSDPNPGAPNGAPGSASRGSHHEFTIEADSDVRLDLLIAGKLGLSRTQSATLIANRMVTVNGEFARASYRAVTGDVIVVDIPAPRSREIVAEQIPLDVVYEDDDLVVVDKAAGMVVHPAPGNWTGTLVNALIGRGSELAESGDADRAGIVHRLDKDTSGLLLVAKSERAHRVLSKAIAERRVVRRYAALTWGHIEGDRLTVEAPIG